IDILIREKDYKRKIRPLMLKSGYTEGIESDHELHWEKYGSIIELHKRIIPSYNKDFYRIIGDGWEWVQDNEYAYVFTHFAKHYRDSGIGISHLVDLEVLRTKATDNGLKELHLDKFYENVQRTLDCWFKDREYDEITERITDTIFRSGEYGTQETAVKSQNLKRINGTGGDYKKARFKDFVFRVCPPYGVMKIRNPILKKLPILLPFFWIWRLLSAPFKGKIRANYEQNKSITQDKSDYKEELNAVGLDYWF
ncbi:MAG: nucleotidyltransferase family protein, partial [Clostridia bacterium]|nr:nucleotidyltransferase family protein [Clostridia bacterium]